MSGQMLVLMLILALNLVTGEDMTIFRYGLDNENICGSHNVIMRLIEDTDLIIINGKLDDQVKTKECVVKFGPSSKANKQSTKLRFETFHIGHCGCYLMVQQSPHQFFDSDVSTLFNFTCEGKPGREDFVTDRGNFIKITLHRPKTNLINYNFIFNVSLTVGVDPNPGLSNGIIIGISVISVIAVLGIVCVVVKYMKINRWSKRASRYEENDEDEASYPRVSHPPVPFHQHPNNTPPPSLFGGNRYTSMPLLESEAQNPPHPDQHACIIGSTDATGRCTICHRTHEDLAHFVGIDNNLQVQPGTDRANNCSLCHRSHEDFAHVIEVDGVTHVTNDPVHSNDSVAPHRHDHRDIPHGNDDADDWNSDEDADVTQNVLIPPSYEMAPPAYEEAVSMPKPRPEETTDPLYQNINDLSSH